MKRVIKLVKCRSCPRFISPRIAQKNAGLCSRCTASFFRSWAQEIGKCR